MPNICDKFSPEVSKAIRDYIKSNSEIFDISTKTTTQQGIRLTEEIKAKIRGEAPQIKTSGKQF